MPGMFLAVLLILVPVVMVVAMVMVIYRDPTASHPSLGHLPVPHRWPQGCYGMNFDDGDFVFIGLNGVWSYYAWWLGVIAIAIAMLVFFRFKNMLPT